jgi:hypothetical protein
MTENSSVMPAKKKKKKKGRKVSKHLYWYEFLTLSEGYKKCCDNGGKGRYAKLYKQFGNVHALTFDEWWARYSSKLFGGPPPYTDQLIKTVEEFVYWGGDEPDSMTVIFNKYAPKSMLRKAFNRLLEEQIPTELGPRVHEDLSYNYTIDSRINTYAMDLTLKVYKIWKEEQSKPEKERMSLYQIGCAAEVPNENSEDNKTDPKQIMRTKVLRYVANARGIIANVEKGFFP